MKVIGECTYSLVRPKANSLTLANRLAQRPPPGLTCDVQAEGDLLAPGLAAVLPGVRLARLLHHQPPPVARGLHTHFRAGTQLLPILVPRHLRLGLGHLAAQRGTRPCHGLHFTVCRLLLGEHHRGLWGQRRIHGVRDTISVRTAAPGKEDLDGELGFGVVGRGSGARDVSGSAPALCSAEVPCLSQQKSHNLCILHVSWLSWQRGLLEKTGPLHMASAGSRGKCSPTFLDGAPVFPIWLCRECFTCSPQRCLRLSTHAYKFYCQLACWHLPVVFSFTV